MHYRQTDVVIAGGTVVDGESQLQQLFYSVALIAALTLSRMTRRRRDARSV